MLRQIYAINWYVKLLRNYRVNRCQRYLIPFSGNTTNHQDPQNSYIGQVLDTKKGNQISLASIYSIIAQKLDIPIYGVNLPQHFILAYLDEDKEKSYENGIK